MGHALKSFIVEAREMYAQHYRIQAKNAQEAIDKVVDGDGDVIEEWTEYTHFSSPDFWVVTEELVAEKEYIYGLVVNDVVLDSTCINKKSPTVAEEEFRGDGWDRLLDSRLGYNIELIDTVGG